MAPIVTVVAILGAGQRQSVFDSAGEGARSSLDIKLKLLDEGLPIPVYAYDGDAGCDLHSRIDTRLEPGQWALVPTGIALAIPRGYAGFVQPRSGLALRHGLTLLNTPGLIDSKYRGEVGVIMVNFNPVEAVNIKRGDRIAQLVLVPVAQGDFRLVTELDDTERGAQGFGSSH